MFESTVDVEDRAQTALADSPIYALRELQVECEGDSLLISGRVSSFYHKQLAQEVVRSVAGSHRVVNEVNVVDS